MSHRHVKNRCLGSKGEEYFEFDNWDERFIKLAKHISEWSKDPSTRIGTVIIEPRTKNIVATGFNGLPRGIDDNERLEDREWKIRCIAHSEVNAIYAAARSGANVQDCHLYCTWPSCSQCAVAIIQAGITRVHRPLVELPDRWVPIMTDADALLQEAGVEIATYPFYI